MSLIINNLDKVLITGSTGLLGVSLVIYLKKRGFNIITHARKNQADKMFDLSNQKRTIEALNQVKPNIIINLVSLTSVPDCEYNINLAYLSNTRSVENIVHWIESSHSDCHLIQISTDHVYDGKGLHTEDNVLITNNYAMTKYAGELAAMRVPSTVLRTNFIGKSRVSYRESLTDWIYNSIISEHHVEVLNDIFFSPLSISVLIEMIELVLTKKPIGIYNLGSHDGMSKAEFDFAFAKSLNLSTNFMTSIASSQAKFLKVYRPKDMRMDVSKFEDTLDVKLPKLIDLIDGIAKEYIEVD